VSNNRYEIQKCHLIISGHRYTYHLFRSAEVVNHRCLVLLHGAGVAGVDTWGNIIMKLTQWQYILVPDFRGMGETIAHSGVEIPYSVSELVQDIHCLIGHLGWGSFDLAGYSLGALVSMLYKQRHSQRVLQQYLLEPGLFDRASWDETKTLREQYVQAVVALRGDNAQKGVVGFLNAISPGRKKLQKTEQIAIARLLSRRLGFANALASVNSEALILDREQLVIDQGAVVSLVGSLSMSSMHQYHQLLATDLPNWQYFSIKGCDHSLPFQRPRQIAAIFNQCSGLVSEESRPDVPG